MVKTVRAFVNAAHGNSAINSIQPGFYRIRTEIPAANAVERLTDPSNRVGRLVIPEGRQLDDTTDIALIRVLARLGRPSAHDRATALAADRRTATSTRVALVVRGVIIWSALLHSRPSAGSVRS